MDYAILYVDSFFRRKSELSSADKYRTYSIASATKKFQDIWLMSSVYYVTGSSEMALIGAVT